MFQTWRLKLREAEEAYKAGDLAKAGRLLVDESLTQFLPGRRLATKVTSRKAERAINCIKSSDFDSAWGEIEDAILLSGETTDVLEARRSLVDAILGNINVSLRTGDATAALEAIDLLEKRKVAGAAVVTLKHVAQRIHSAANLVKRGKFSEAEAQLEAAMRLRPDFVELEQGRADCRGWAEKARVLTEQLHHAMVEQSWSEVVALADQLLQLAPESALAKEARKRAWAKVGATVVDSMRGTDRWSCENGIGKVNGERFLLWVDGVGGYLVCLASEILLGQAAPGNRVDVPILADISRRHARIARDGEGYTVEPLHILRLNGESIQTKTILSDGDEIEFGSGVCFRFRRPHALSASARLDVISRHRTQPFADSILLMAESCVLGPRWQNHVVCCDWEADVVLYRQDGELYCRAMEAIEIDGELCDGRGRLSTNSHVAGSDFSMSLEELDRCTTQPLL
ncbi:MAG: FHA domain-containing protein [Planctomycetaceae bacterium]|nr:FHA domain-containing protein [Planctomycetales bacterium]MCB9925716.1 FHA domain-containing protein [Planctomycetaceae bacterium]